MKNSNRPAREVRGKSVEHRVSRGKKKRVEVGVSREERKGLLHSTPDTRCSVFNTRHPVLDVARGKWIVVR